MATAPGLPTAAISAPILVVFLLQACTDGYGLRRLLPAVALAPDSDHGSVSAEHEATLNDTMKSVPPKRSGLKGDLFLQQGGRQSFSQNQIALLGAIVSAGSISGAARLIGISYKTAWDRIDAMNNLSTKPLVIRSPEGPREAAQN